MLFTRSAATFCMEMYVRWARVVQKLSQTTVETAHERMRFKMNGPKMYLLWRSFRLVAITIRGLFKSLGHIKNVFILPHILPDFSIILRANFDFASHPFARVLHETRRMNTESAQ